MPAGAGSRGEGQGASEVTGSLPGRVTWPRQPLVRKMGRASRNALHASRSSRAGRRARLTQASGRVPVPHAAHPEQGRPPSPRRGRLLCLGWTPSPRCHRAHPLRGERAPGPSMPAEAGLRQASPEWRRSLGFGQHVFLCRERF